MRRITFNAEFHADKREMTYRAIGEPTVGVLAGRATERCATEQKGMEYGIETSSGNLMAVAHGTDLACQRSGVLYRFTRPTEC